jgi:hypothetical protein
MVIFQLDALGVMAMSKVSFIPALAMQKETFNQGASLE